MNALQSLSSCTREARGLAEYVSAGGPAALVAALGSCDAEIAGRILIGILYCPPEGPLPGLLQLESMVAIRQVLASERDAKTAAAICLVAMRAIADSPAKGVPLFFRAGGIPAALTALRVHALKPTEACFDLAIAVLGLLDVCLASLTSRPDPALRTAIEDGGKTVVVLGLSVACHAKRLFAGATVREGVLPASSASSSAPGTTRPAAVGSEARPSFLNEALFARVFRALGLEFPPRK